MNPLLNPFSEPISIPKDEVHVIFCATPVNFEQEQLTSLRRILNQTEQDKVDRYKFPRDQHQSLISRALLRSICSYYLGSKRPDDWTFSTGEKGKPFLTNMDSPLYFNISHTEGLIALAVSQYFDVGVDVEYTPRNSDTASIADRYFSEFEVNALHRLPQDQQNNHFFDYWTLKESYIKACGLGLSIPLDSFSFDIDRSDQQSINSNIQLQFHKGRQDSNEYWQSFLMNVGREHRGALSIFTPDKFDKNLKVKTFHCLPLEAPQELTLPFTTS